MSDRPTPSAVCLPRIQVLGTSVGAREHWGGFQGQDPSHLPAPRGWALLASPCTRPAAAQVAFPMGFMMSH